MPPSDNPFPQADRPNLPSTNNLSSRTPASTSQSEGRSNTQATPRDSTSVPSSYTGSSIMQAAEDSLSRLGTSSQSLGEFPRGVARSYIGDEGPYSLVFPNEIPSPPSLNADIAQEEYAGEAEMNRQRKRKRLASWDISAHHYPPYGHKGQVVPGLLKLDVVDVNTHEGNTCKDANYQAHILRRNWSIFATQTDHCDVILAHKGRVPFSVSKVVIKVPTTTTYRAPIGEGLVFVAMAASEFKRTVHYRLHSPQLTESSESRGTHNRFHDRPPSRRADNPGYTPRSVGNIPPTQPPNLEWRQLGSHWVRHSHRAHHRPSSDLVTPPRVLSPPIPDSEYQVHTASNEPSSESEADKSDDESEASTTSGRATPERRTRARSDTPRPAFSPTPPLVESDDEDLTTTPRQATIGHRTHGMYMRASNDHGTTDPGAYVTSNSRRRRLRLYKERESDGNLDQKSEGGEHGQAQDVLHPHARFTFGKGKTRVAIRFDPPVSGKFILLKLWSRNEDQSIDIQNISAYGYVGQRFFASVQAQ